MLTLPVSISFMWDKEYLCTTVGALTVSSHFMSSRDVSEQESVMFVVWCCNISGLGSHYTVTTIPSVEKCGFKCCKHLYVFMQS